MSSRSETKSDQNRAVSILKRNQELELLNDLVYGISGLTDTGEILRYLQDTLTDNMQILGGAIFLFQEYRFTQSEDSVHLQLDRHWQLPEALYQYLQHLYLQPEKSTAPFPQDKVQQSYLTRHEFWQSAPIDDRPQWRVCLWVPIRLDGQLLGGFCLFTDNEAGWFPARQQFFQTIARYTATALQKAELFEELHVSRERLRRLAHRIFTVQEEERQRIAQELHDEAGQALTGLKISLEMIRADLPAPTSDRTELKRLQSIGTDLDDAVRLCEKTMGRIRRLAHDLRPAALDNLGLNATLHGFCRKFSSRAKLPIHYRGQDTTDLPDAIEICLYRFLQEALTNVVRHANATAVDVLLQQDENTISLTVADDGDGFDLDEAKKQSTGIGLSGMRGRIEAVGGHLTLQTRPGDGTRLVAWIPL